MQLSQKTLRQNSSEKQNGRSCFRHYLQSGFNWLVGMEKQCLCIIISIMFLNKLSDHFLSLFMRPIWLCGMTVTKLRENPSVILLGTQDGLIWIIYEVCVSSLYFALGGWYIWSWLLTFTAMKLYLKSQEYWVLLLRL